MKAITFYIDLEDMSGLHFVPAGTTTADALASRTDVACYNSGLMVMRWHITTYGLLAGPSMETK